MKSIYLKSLTLFIALVIAVSCTVQDKPLPIFGERLIENGDTIFHTIAPFAFRDQDSVLITNETVKGKIYVADFFFTSCRTICPKMKAQMLRVYEATANQEDFLILSHTIDPEYDDVTRLHDFAERLDVESKRWHFLTGVRDSIFKIAQTSYFATAMADEAEPDGYIHSGAFLLIDKEGRIRGKYDGTVAKDVDKLIADIKRLRFQEK
jgi:protein SCO1/2